MTVAKVFKNGRSQAIRLPQEFRVETEEVYLKRTREGFLVIPRDPWEVFFEGVAELSEEFFRDGRTQPELERRGGPGMIFMLDSDLLIFMIRGLKASPRHRAQRERAAKLVEQCRQAQKEGHIVGISVITVSHFRRVSGLKVTNWA